jgi:hypothetical protein
VAFLSKKKDYGIGMIIENIKECASENTSQSTK